MLILTIRTDKPEAEIGLYQNETRLVYDTWSAHRALGQTIHAKVAGLLDRTGNNLSDIAGIVAFQGPGSFTGLRIGLTVANTLAYGLPCAIVGSTNSADTEDWLASGITRLLAGESETIALPEYGSEAHITLPRK